MADQNLVNILGVGLCSSMGGYRDACAAYRAGITRFSDHEHMAVMFPGEEEPSALTIAPAATNLEGYQGVGRIVKMLSLAHADLLENTRAQIDTDGLTVLIALPKPEDRHYEIGESDELSRDEQLQHYAKLITEPLFSRIDPRLHQLPMQLVFGDRVAFARILNKACGIMTSAQARQCLLLVADSLLNDETLDALLAQQKVKTADNPVGFIPGEGAAMILLSAGEGVGQSVAITTSIDNTAIEAPPDEDSDAQEALAQWRGDKLVKALAPLLHAFEGQVLPQLIADMNGEECRARECGFLRVALKREFPAAQVPEFELPALGFGEVGTMMGPLALLITLAAVARGYLASHEVIITLSEACGKRAAIKLQLN